MKNTLILFAFLLAWTAEWVLQSRAHQQQVARSVTALLGPEIQLGMETQPFLPGPGLARLAANPELDAARLTGADEASRWSFGSAVAYDCRLPVIESGQLLGRLEVHFRPAPPPLALAVAWLAWLALTLMHRAESGQRPRSLVLELDEKRRIRRLSGDPHLLSKASGDLIGQSLDHLMNGPLGEGRTLSELAGGSARSLVVVRDSQDLRKVRRRLRQLELQYRGLCDGAHDLIMLLEPEGNVIFSNRALMQQLGGAIPSQIQELFAQSGIDSVKEQLHNALLEGKSGEFESQLSSGVPISGSFSALAADPASPLSVLGIFRDLTAQRAAEASLRQAQKMEAVGRLAGGVAHDMNNFLSIFSGLTSLIREDRDNPDLVAEYLGELDQALESAAELVKQLLHFTRKRGQERQKFEVDPAVAEIARMASRLLGPEIKLETSLHSQNQVWGERTQLDQVILNLLVNARDAMPRGGRVRLTTRALSGWTELQVCDEGSGMDEQTAARIFEPYFTTKEMGKGTGLGLSTVYAVVNAWGGRLTVDSRPGQGTTFTILLPCA